jgi:hypothetical protein
MKCWFVHSIILNVELCSIHVLEASLNTVSLKVFVKKCYFFLSENLTFPSKVSFCLHLPPSTDDV